MEHKLTVFWMTIISLTSCADLAKAAVTTARLLVVCSCSFMAAPLTAPLKFVRTSSKLLSVMLSCKCVHLHDSLYWAKTVNFLHWHSQCWWKWRVCREKGPHSPTHQTGCRSCWLWWRWWGSGQTGWCQQEYLATGETLWPLHHRIQFLQECMH